MNVRRLAYDEIGRTYAVTRSSDPRIAGLIEVALDGCTTVVVVGAGTGSYEPRRRCVVAVEPSEVMIRQRPPGSHPVVRAVAEDLPFGDGSFDAALAVLTVHHWRDRERGIAEMARISSRRVVILTWDPRWGRGRGYPYWLITDYLPEMGELDAGRFPSMDEFGKHLANGRAVAVPVPRDCADGFGGAFWARPESYLDPAVRAGMSSMCALDPDVVARFVDRLSDDLRSGRWDARFGHLRELVEADLGYRLVIGEPRDT